MVLWFRTQRFEEKRRHGIRIIHEAANIILIRPVQAGFDMSVSGQPKSVAIVTEVITHGMNQSKCAFGARNFHIA